MKERQRKSEKDASNKSDASMSLSDGADFSEMRNRIHTDPLGSWTGVPEQTDERPIQDVDDL